MNLGLFGVWSFHFYLNTTKESIGLFRELERHGVPTCWIPERPGRDVLTFAGLALSETRELRIGTGIANLWLRDPETMAAGQRTLWDRFPERFLLGIGVSHRPVVEGQHHEYGRPLDVMNRYLDRMTTAEWPGLPLPSQPPTVLAALGPKMLRLAADRTAGAHPYLVTVEHTAWARKQIGDSAILAPEQTAILETDPGRARKLARTHLSHYRNLPNYRENLQRLGFTDEDWEEGGSDALVDAVYAWGDVDAVVQRVHDHLEAGADHVAIQLIDSDLQKFPMEGWRRLAPALGAITPDSFSRTPRPSIAAAPWES